jgi:hypothetical protein
MLDRQDSTTASLKQVVCSGRREPKEREDLVGAEERDN